MTNAIVRAVKLKPGNTQLATGALHWNIVCCIKGSLSIETGSSRLNLSESDIAVLPPETESRINCPRDAAAICLTMENLAVKEALPFTVSAPDNRRMLSAAESAFSYFCENSAASSELLPAYGSLIAAFVRMSLHHSGNKRIVYLMQREITDNACDYEFDTGRYLSSLPFSSDYLSRLFRNEFGVTPHQYLTDVRLETARQLLMHSDGNNISEIAHLSGFRDPLYFSRLFSRKYGMPPSRITETD